MYLYDPKTKELVGQRDATARPGGRGYILQGTFATPVAPPANVPAGYATRWTGEMWELVEDHRQKFEEKVGKYGGTPYWLPGDTWRSEPRYMNELGPLPADALLTKPEKTTEELASEVRTVRNALLSSTSWLIERHKEQIAGGIKTSILEEDYAALLSYRQSLRDLPQQPGFPWDGPDDPACPWPAMPALTR